MWYTVAVIEHDRLLGILKARFEAHPERHGEIPWSAVRAALEDAPGKLRSLAEMEESGGEPDLVGRDPDTEELLYVDCSAESPAGRRSLCYDQEALDGRKEHKPASSALGRARAMNIELLTEAQYRRLQTLGEYDKKTSSWVSTPQDIRKLGGALFCDRRYSHVFVYHNGADSYYSSRGFRGLLRI